MPDRGSNIGDALSRAHRIAIETRRTSRCEVVVARGFVENSSLDDLAATVAPDFASTVDGWFVLHDPAVAAPERWRETATVLTLHGGEENKRLDQVETHLRRLYADGANRSSCLVCLGGGVTTDVGGFVASLYMRGIRFINVPTTLLAMVDAGIGGKTGVDLEDGKNIVGTVEAPQAVVVDPDFLATLPDIEMAQGWAEVVKTALMLDADFFRRLQDGADHLVRRDSAAVDDAVRTSVMAKAAVVREDEREHGRRALLNFGHTVGHALEVLSGYRLAHGHAVAIGMMAELRIASELAETEIVAVEGLLTRFGLPTAMPTDVSPEALFEVMRRDKKATRRAVRVAVPQTIGAGIVVEIEREQIDVSWP